MPLIMLIPSSQGLEDVYFEEDADPPCNLPVSLVSNGAELIMLSRKFFISHATEKTKQFIREQVLLYPTEDTLQVGLELIGTHGEYQIEIHIT